MQQLQTLFAAHTGEPYLQCLSIAGGGSKRQYYRLVGKTHTCIGTIATDQRENEAFFALSTHFAQRNIPVPQVYAIAPDRCHYLQQDLGDQSLYLLLADKRRQGGGFDAEMVHLYEQALADLDAMQRAAKDFDFDLCYPRAAFDSRAMLWDLNYFKYYFLKLAGIDFDEDRLQDDFERFVALLHEADCSYFMYRDFQGRNIMVGTEQPRLHYIDYQGGRRGAAQYDVASLLYSAKSDLPDALRRHLLQHYVALHADPTFMQHFWPYVLMRIMQTLGAYGYRGLYERKPYFIESIPLAINNLRSVTSTYSLPTNMPELARVLGATAAYGTGSQPVAEGLTVEVQSFSYQRGLPADNSGNGGGHVFDCRALPNPGRYPQYRCYTGHDAPVIEFLKAQVPVAQFLQLTSAIVCQSVDKYLERRFTHLCVSFGCTGGQHRSVYCAEQTAAMLRAHYPHITVLLSHREQPNIK